MVFGEFVSLNEIGIVYLGTYRLQPVAIKQINNSTMTEEELDEFRREAALMMNLKPHKNGLVLCKSFSPNKWSSLSESLPKIPYA